MKVYLVNWYGSLDAYDETKVDCDGGLIKIFDSEEKALKFIEKEQGNRFGKEPYEGYWDSFDLYVESQEVE